MMTSLHTSAAVVTFITSYMLSSAGGLNILLVPYQGGHTSHVMDMLKIGDILQEEGHEIHFLVPELLKSRIWKGGFRSLTYPTPRDFNQSFVSDALFAVDDRKQIKLINMIFQNFQDFCSSFLQEQTLHEQLKNHEFDVIFFDFAEPCGVFVGGLVNSLTIIKNKVGYYESNKAYFPSLPSFIPGVLTSLPSDMTYLERIQNFGNFIALWMFNVFVFKRMFHHISM